MTSPSSKPLIVIVPGSGHTPSHYSSLIDRLQEAGWPTFTALLPSVSPAKPISVADEAAFVRERMLLPPLDVHGTDVVLVMHSSSSVPGSAAAKGLSKAERAAQGKTTSVIGQIFVAAMLGREGTPIMDLLGGKLPPHIILDEPAGVFRAPDPIPGLYPDVPVDRAHAAAGAILPHSSLSFTTPAPAPSWPDAGFRNRLAYVYATNDAPIPSEGQRAKIVGSGVPWIEKSLQSGHSPQLSQPENLAKLIIEFTETFLEIQP